jgi:hypothetical protein
MAENEQERLECFNEGKSFGYEWAADDLSYNGFILVELLWEEYRDELMAEGKWLTFDDLENILYQDEKTLLQIRTQLNNKILSIQLGYNWDGKYYLAGMIEGAMEYWLEIKSEFYKLDRIRSEKKSFSGELAHYDGISQKTDMRSRSNSIPLSSPVLKCPHIGNVSKKWTMSIMPIRDWKAALNRFEELNLNDNFPSKFILATKYLTDPRFSVC